VRVIDSTIAQLTAFIALLLALFLTDCVTMASAPDSIDTTVSITLCVVLAYFSVEFSLNCACRVGTEGRTGTPRHL
jgi:uncharacterized protein YacL